MLGWEVIHERTLRHIINFQTLPDITPQDPDAHRGLLRRLPVIHVFQFLKGHVPTDISSLLPTAWVSSGVISDFAEYWSERGPVDHSRFFAEIGGCRVGRRG
jgi:hypothetical protein